MEPPAKRLRGWKLEKAMAEQKSSSSTDPAPRGKQSALASKLLALWAHGSLSAVQVQEVAHLAVLDGAKHPELAALAKAGTFGEHPGNVHKSLMNRFCKEAELSAPHEITVPCVDPKSNKVVQEQAAIFYPHLVFLQWQGTIHINSRPCSTVKGWRTFGSKPSKQGTTGWKAIP